MNTTPETDETLTARDQYGNEYSVMFGAEWAEMTRDQRESIIEEDAYRAEKEAEEEAKKAAALEEETAIKDAYEAQRKKMKSEVEALAEERDYSVSDWRGFTTIGGSEYAWLESKDGEDQFCVRLSDHPQGGNGQRGGFYVDAHGNGGAHAMAEISIEAKPGEAYSLVGLSERLQRGA